MALLKITNDRKSLISPYLYLAIIIPWILGIIYYSMLHDYDTYYPFRSLLFSTLYTLRDHLTITQKVWKVWAVCFFVELFAYHIILDSKEKARTSALMRVLCKITMPFAYVTMFLYVSNFLDFATDNINDDYPYSNEEKCGIFSCENHLLENFHQVITPVYLLLFMLLLYFFRLVRFTVLKKKFPDISSDEIIYEVRTSYFPSDVIVMALAAVMSYLYYWFIRSHGWHAAGHI